MGLKSDVDILHIDKLKTALTNLDNLELEVAEIKNVPVDIKKLSDFVGKDIIKKRVHDLLVLKVDGKEGNIPSTTKLINQNMVLINKFHQKNENVDEKYHMLVLG